MVRTRVGYTGGTSKNPTYTKIGDHTESLQLEYAPRVITYEQLLEIFWKSHNPCEKPYSRQYMTAVFYHNETQKQLALKTRDQAAERLKRKIETPILPLGEFTLAEDYHQKYYVKQVRGLYQELRAIYPSEKDFMNSTAVMRVNAFVGGYGKLETLEKEIGSYGLSPQTQKALLVYVRARR